MAQLRFATVAASSLLTLSPKLSPRAEAYCEGLSAGAAMTVHKSFLDTLFLFPVMPENTLSQKTEQLVENLDSKIEHIDSSDFRFYNIGRLPLLAKQTANHAEMCSRCKENFSKIESLINSLPECLTNPKDRKEFDDMKNEIAKHLEKTHNVRLANYHYSLYTFIGLLAGALLGYILQIFYQQRLWAIFAILGATAGAAYGKRVEWKRNKEKKLM